MNLIAEYQQSLIDAAYSVNVNIYGMNLIAEYQQSLIDAAYSVNVNIYGMNLIAEYDHLWLMRFIPWAYNNLIDLIDLILYVHSTIFQLCGTVLPGFNQY